MLDEQESAAVLSVRGPLDDRSAADLVARATQALDESPRQRLYVDLTEMDFMDSSGIGALVTVHSLAITHNAVMTLRGASVQQVGLLERVGLAQVLSIER